MEKCHDRQGDAAFENTRTTEPILWQINHPGDYTIRFSNRDDGAALDAFVLQLASLSAPHGDGPEECVLAASVRDRGSGAC